MNPSVGQLTRWLNLSVRRFCGARSCRPGGPGIVCGSQDEQLLAGWGVEAIWVSLVNVQEPVLTERLERHLGLPNRWL